MTLDEIIEQKATEYGNQFLNKDVKDSEFIAQAADCGYSKGFKDASAIEFGQWISENIDVSNYSVEEDKREYFDEISKEWYTMEQLYHNFLTK